ncbi:hypothetical protein GCM10027035_41200 [Emticicia sediminis]
MEKKTIQWLTPDYFLDTDFNIVPKLCEYFNIDWVVIIPAKDPRYSVKDFENFNDVTGLTIKLEFCNYRYRDPRYLLTYFRLFRNFNKRHADLVYLNYVPTPYFTPMAICLLNRRKTILTAHQGEVHSGFNFQIIYKTVYKLSYSWFKINNLFSKSQAAIFQKHYPNNEICMIPLGLKDFGQSTHTKPTQIVSFFTFGGIRPKKNIDVLIDAACLVYEKGYKNFKIVIAGSCDNWHFYQEKIKYPEIFELEIRTIDNSEIPDLFSRNHYLILPYTIVTQSGPLKIAYNYKVPVIVSDQPGFTDEVIEGVNGYSFKTGDKNDLAKILIYAIENHNAYDNLVIKHSESIHKSYSDSVILGKYVSMINNVINKYK